MAISAAYAAEAHTIVGVISAVRHASDAGGAMYSNPELVVQKQQELAIREKHGCAACATRGREILGKYLCRIDQEPGRRGFCRLWRLDQTWGKDAI